MFKINQIAKLGITLAMLTTLSCNKKYQNDMKVENSLPKIHYTYERDLEKYPLSPGKDAQEENVEKGKCNNFGFRNKYDNNAKAIYIVQHFTVVDFDKTIKIFTDGEEILSAHYIINIDGEIEELVGTNLYRAYHAGLGYLKKDSCLCSKKLGIDYEKLKGKSGKGDLNPYSVGIENVNTGMAPFRADQIHANALLCDYICKENPGIVPELMLGHSDWSPGRKVDPGPYFPWEDMANAKEKFGTLNNFGIFPNLEEMQDLLISKPVLLFDMRKTDSLNSNPELEKENEISEKFIDGLNKLGYKTDDRDNIKNACLSFRIHFSCKDIRNNPELIDTWNSWIAQQSSDIPEKLWVPNENDLTYMEDVIDQYSKSHYESIGFLERRSKL